MKNNNWKLVTVTRRDLELGYQSVQSNHAGIQFQHEYPGIAREWYQESNTLVQLTASDERELQDLTHKCQSKDLSVSVFYEPDVGNQITAICIQPSKVTRKLVSKLPLLK